MIKRASPPAGITKNFNASIWFLVAVLVFLAAAFTLNRPPHPTPASTAENASVISPQDIPKLIANIRRHLAVNEQETPLVANVVDVDSARKQSPEFYKNSQNGDNLVVWTDKAVLYSPTRDEVIAVLLFKSPEDESAASSTVALERARVEVRNGSGATGLATLVAVKLREQGLNVTRVTNALSKNAYPFTLVMPLTSKPLPLSAQVLSAFAKPVSATSTPDELPASADFLVIVGSDAVGKY